MGATIYDQNVEEMIYAFLLNEIQQIEFDQQRSFDILRCNFFHIGVNWKEDDITELKESLSKYDDMNIYLCNDGDVILMWPPNTQDYNVETIMDMIMELYGERISKYMSPYDFFEFFNLNQETKIFRRIISKKLGKVTKAAKDLYNMLHDFNLVKTFYHTMKIIAMQRTYRAKPHILLVEDQIFSQKLVQAALKDYTVHVVPSTSEAILAYLEKCPDIVLLDIDLPDLDGHTLASVLNSIDDDAFIVMLTAHNVHSHVAQAKENNVKKFISKPFKKDELLSVIKLYEKTRKKKNGKLIKS